MVLISIINSNNYQKIFRVCEIPGLTNCLFNLGFSRLIKMMNGCYIRNMLEKKFVVAILQVVY